MTPRQYTPTPEERDERVNTKEKPAELIRKVLKAGPHPKKEKEQDAGESSGP